VKIAENNKGVHNVQNYAVRVNKISNDIARPAVPLR